MIMGCQEREDEKLVFLEDSIKEDLYKPSL